MPSNIVPSEGVDRVLLYDIIICYTRQTNLEGRFDSSDLATVCNFEKIRKHSTSRRLVDAWTSLTNPESIIGTSGGIRGKQHRLRVWGGIHSSLLWRTCKRFVFYTSPAYEGTPPSQL